MFALYFVVFCATLFLWLLRSLRRHKDEPPGPQKLPILGNLIDLVRAGVAESPVKAFHTLAMKYGGIFSVQIGLQSTIVVSKWEDYKEVMVREELGERAITGCLLDRNMGGTSVGIAFANGEPWKIMRRWVVRTLRDFGFGKKTTQGQLMIEEGKDLVEYIEQLQKADGESVRVHNLHSLSTLNVLWSMVAGFRYQLHDQRLRKLLYLSSEQLKASNFSASATAAFPFLRFIFPGLTGRTTLQLATKNLRSFLAERLYENRVHDYANNPECLVDCFLAKMDEEKDKKDAVFTEKNFVMTLTDLFQGGADTSSNILDYGILFMMHYPGVLKKAQEEIDRVIGTATITMEDREKLPYVHATCIEMMRCANTLPIQVNRRVTKEFYSRGYKFPEGYTVLANVYTVFNDPDFWEEPEKFKPERYLDENNKFIPRVLERVVPFGAGKRICPGQVLGDQIVFMFFAYLAQHFDITGVKGQPLPTTVPRDGMTWSPRPFNAVFTRR